VDRTLENPDAESIKNTRLKDLVSPETLVNAESGVFTSRPLKHFFGANQYMRVMEASLGDVVVGKKHKFKTLNVLLKGKVIVYTKGNEFPLVLSAGDYFESDEQTRKILVMLEDSRFANIHVTGKTDVDEIEEEFIVPETPEMIAKDVYEIFGIEAPACLG